MLTKIVNEHNNILKHSTIKSLLGLTIYGLTVRPIYQFSLKCTILDHLSQVFDVGLSVYHMVILATINCLYLIVKENGKKIMFRWLLLKRSNCFPYLHQYQFGMSK